MFERVGIFIVILFFIMGMITAMRSIGEERKPMTNGQAVSIAVLDILMILFFYHVATVIPT